MSNSANFRQNAEQGQSLKKLNTLMSEHTTSQTTTTASVNALKLSTDTKLDTLHSDLGTLNTSVIANLPPSGVALASHQTTANSHLNTIANSFGTQATASNQSTANGHLNTLATASSSQATATNQSTANGHLNTLATASSSQATAGNQASAVAHLNTIASNSELQGYTDITDNTTGVRLSADSNGRLKVVDQYSSTLANQLTTINANTTKSRVVSRLTSVPSISANTGGTSYDLGADYGSYKHLKITGDTQGVPAGDMYLQISNDNVNWNFVVGMAFITLNGGGNMGFFLSSSIQQPLRYWRIFNNSGVDATPSFDSLMSIVSIE